MTAQCRGAADRPRSLPTATPRLIIAYDQPERQRVSRSDP
jgi:hypothetical protein